MKTNSFIYLLLTIFLFGCSSSNDDNTNVDNNVYFNFTLDGKNYSSNVDGGLLCMMAQPNESGTEINILMNHNNPSNNTATCGVSLLGIDNSVGTTNNCIFGLGSGNDYITCNNLIVVLTEVGDFYVGTFSGNFNVFSLSPLSDETISGSGSFRVRKSI
jgi:hypothetical protein